jgi:lactam utilization protein B
LLTTGGSEVSVQAQTICIHSDTENAIVIARALRRAFQKERIKVQPL